MHVLLFRGRGNRGDRVSAARNVCRMLTVLYGRVCVCVHREQFLLGQEQFIQRTVYILNSHRIIESNVRTCSINVPLSAARRGCRSESCN